MSSRATPELKYLVSQCGEDKAACVNSEVDCCTPSKTQSAIAPLCSHPAHSIPRWTHQPEHRTSPVSPKAAGVCVDTWQHAGL